MTRTFHLPLPRGLAGAALWPALAAGLAFLPLSALAAAALLVATLLWPPLLLVLLAWAVPFGDLAGTAAGTMRLTPVQPLLALGAAGLSGRALLAGRLPGMGRARPLLAPLALFLGSLALAGWWAPRAELVFKELARWGSMALAIWLAARLAGPTEAAVQRRGAARDQTTRGRAWEPAFVLALVLAAGAVEAAWGIRGALLREGPEAYAALGGRILRAHGHFGQPNPFGAYMNQIWPLALAPMASWLLGQGAAAGDRRPPRTPPALAAWGALVGVLALAGLLLSWSRGAWLGAAAAGAAMAAAVLAGALGGGARRRGLAVLWLGLFLGLAGLWAGGLERLPPAVVDRLASSAEGGGWLIDVRDAEVTDANFAKIERLAHWRAALAMWAERPWLGQGPGHFAAVYDRFRLPRWRDPLGHAHNLYLNLLAEAGLLGLGSFLLCYGAAWALALRACLRPAGGLEGALGLGLVGVLAAIGVHSLLDHPYVHDLAVQLGLSLGLLLAARGGGGHPATETA
jgi:O-antigen ligase